MSKTYSAGIVTAYGAAKRAGYHGTYEDFCRQQAGYAESAATVEQAKNTAVSAANTATTKAGEATTAATAAQTAKTQTEAAASQALTDISTARSGAISAVQTEGTTQTANARAQAQAAATSATTASTKASEATASATSAGQSATNAAASATSAASSASAAQAVLESIPEEYSDLSEDVDQLKADLQEQDARLLVLDGKVTSEWEIGQRNTTDGQEVLYNSTSRIRTKAGTYIEFKEGDVITVKDLITYQFLVGYSTDNGSTFTGTSNRAKPFVIPANSIGFVCIRKLSGNFTESEMNDVVNDGFVIIRNNTDVVKSNKNLINATIDGSKVFSGFDVLSCQSGVTSVWCAANATSIVTLRIGQASATKGDVFAISLNATVSHPEFFTNVGFTIYERNANDTATQKSRLVTNISEPYLYEISNANTALFGVCVTLLAESGSITTGFEEFIDYDLSIIKKVGSGGIDDVLTESGDTWEV